MEYLQVKESKIAKLIRATASFILLSNLNEAQSTIC